MIKTYNKLKEKAVTMYKPLKQFKKLLLTIKLGNIQPFALTPKDLLVSEILDFYFLIPKMNNLSSKLNKHNQAMFKKIALIAYELL